MRTLTEMEIQQVSGASIGDDDKPTRQKLEGATAFAAVGAIGAATFGASWGAVAVGAAFVAAPVAVAAMVGLSVFGAYSMMRSRGG